jgi:acyl carrier protein
MLARRTGIEASAITVDLHLEDDLGIDSVDAAELVVALEQKTGTVFELRELGDVATVSAVIERLLALVDAAALAGRSAGT